MNNTIARIFFACVIITELISEWTGNITLHYVSKPLIMICLIGYAWIETRTINHPIKKYFFAAMIFGWIGDINLMFTGQYSFALQIGMAAFLLGHCFYIVAYQSGSNNWFSVRVGGSFAILLFIGISIFLQSYLGEMATAIRLYGVVILVMASTAYHRRSRVSIQSYRLVFMGAVFFVASDAILLVNLFIRKEALLGVMLMALYIAAQTSICLGLVRQIQEESVSTL